MPPADAIMRKGDRPTWTIESIAGFLGLSVDDFVSLLPAPAYGQRHAENGYLAPPVEDSPPDYESSEDRDTHVLELRSTGKSTRQIADAVGCSQTTRGNTVMTEKYRNGRMIHRQAGKFAKAPSLEQLGFAISDGKLLACRHCGERCRPILATGWICSNCGNRN